MNYEKKGAIGRALLDEIIDWISEHLEPDDVFTEEQLEDWARDWAKRNGFIKDIR